MVVNPVTKQLSQWHLLHQLLYKILKPKYCPELITHVQFNTVSLYRIKLQTALCKLHASKKYIIVTV